ncbi:TetR/AcrR family transcriptional regulator [Streptomyces sp. NPDC056230]|uniref:TetR/AcrR family transcriptional regulator n=1 Tax=unclassified Streptomyces TaxID=2593676 RepID=UPI0035E329D6
MDAATDLIARHGPDGVGLRRVAETVGVTHGLVTHYFGTYRALVRAVLERENERKRELVRERMRADGSVPYADGMTRVLFEILGDGMSGSGRGPSCMTGTSRRPRTPRPICPGWSTRSRRGSVRSSPSPRGRTGRGSRRSCSWPCPARTATRSAGATG